MILKYFNEVDQNRVEKVNKFYNKKIFKHFRNSFILAFSLELLIVKYGIYENIIIKTTKRRCSFIIRL